MQNQFGLSLLVIVCFLGTLPHLFGQTAYDSLTTGRRIDGFIDYFHDEENDQILLDVPKDLGDFIYVTSLAAGVGSNDLGLDRGQLGETRLVRFIKAGNKLLLEQPNLAYRAESNNEAERRSVSEAFATSILAGFPILATSEKSYLINLTPLLIDDTHRVAQRLEEAKEGNYKLDKLLSALFLDRTKNFPRNTEFEAIITLSGEAIGSQLPSVTPTPSKVTTRQHHSFVALPEPGYSPRKFDPGAGYLFTQFADYASPIGTPLEKRLIYRHRLKKKNPEAARSEPVEPIIYYVDPGAPEPVRSALIEGASWWNQAFEAAGFINAFRVEVLPEGADPLDVRYNVIQWVHRSTRGWSYGYSVADPRTGEIIKGHVSLGSLRIRQDFLIAQGLIEAYPNGVEDPRLLEFALARLRQLSAHEVGHAIGLTHNFAASTNDRSSVMDYPHPLVTLGKNGIVDLSDAYAVGIGAWDKQAISYGYREFSPQLEEAGLKAILAENAKQQLNFISDEDARPVGGASSIGHLWDNGKDANAELVRIIALRKHSLDRLKLNNLAFGRPVSELENVLAPVYLMHRYQVEAAAKLVGGVDYRYAMNDGSPFTVEALPYKVQAEAIATLSSTLSPSFLQLSPKLLSLLPPPALGYSRDRELFDSRTGLVFDPVAAAESSVDHTIRYLLHPERITRLVQATETPDTPLAEVLAKALLSAQGSRTKENAALWDMARSRMVEHALLLAANTEGSASSRAWAYALAQQLVDSAGAMKPILEVRLDQWRTDPNSFNALPGARIPDGSPIGCMEH